MYGTLLAWSTEFAESEQELNRLAMQADRTYDAALQADKHHWDARMSKAAFYAASDYKPWEDRAVRLLERLIADQETRALERRFFNAYLVLGDLHESRGRTDEAKRTWQRGLRLHPGNDALRLKLISVGE